MPNLSQYCALLMGFNPQEGGELGKALRNQGMRTTEGGLGMPLEAQPGQQPFDLVVVSSSSMEPENLTPAVIHTRLAHPNAKLVVVSGTLPRPDLLALAFVEVDVIVHRPFRMDLVMALVEVLLGKQGDEFKTCPSCRQVWQDREAFLEDKTIDLLGLQVGFRRPGEGYLLFNHMESRCCTTLALPISNFLDFCIGPRFQQNAYATAACTGHCLEVDSLAPCLAECTQRTSREVMLALLSHFRSGQGA